MDRVLFPGQVSSLQEEFRQEEGLRGTHTVKSDMQVLYSLDSPSFIGSTCLT